jgi:hypothetical protein
MPVIIYILSRLVVPELVYNSAEPRRIKQEDNPPNKKYVNPLAVDDSESLYKEQIIYKP